jgi:hypothetical protein
VEADGAIFALTEQECSGLTIDEELNLLEESVRRLKIEYDVYFGGGAKRPPSDTEGRVQTLIRKFSDSSKLTSPQRFRYNGVAQRYAIFSDLWRKKMKIKEEGYRRPQDAALGIQGLRYEQEHQAEAALQASPERGSETIREAVHEAFPSQPTSAIQPFKVACADVECDQAAVQSLFKAMLNAKQLAGQAADPNSFGSFKSFLKKKTEQIRTQYGCPAVEFSVEIENGQARLKAKAKS